MSGTDLGSSAPAATASTTPTIPPTPARTADRSFPPTPVPTSEPPLTPTPTSSPAVDPTSAPESPADQGSTTLYVNPDTQVAEAAAEATGETRTLLDRIAQTPQAMWIGDWEPNADMAASVTTYTRGAVDAGEIAVLVLYAIPGRDCGEYSAGGVETSEYAAWVDAMAAAVVGEPWVIVEPDALSQLGECEGQGDRVGYLQYAAQKFDEAGARVYLDAGNRDWMSAEKAADRLSKVGFEHAVGFSLNVSNFYSTGETAAYAQKISDLLGGGPSYVIDVSRNGNGSNGEWCNPRGRALGEAPHLVDDSTNLDAALWIKLPGESDGTCDGGPASGRFWVEIAVEMATNAGW